jgi:arylsulfatase A-like enzyme
VEACAAKIQYFGSIMTKLLLCLLLVSTVGFTQSNTKSVVPAGKPNILYIMSDDHDADAISAYSKKFIQTPNLDSLAKEGIKFNKAFVGNSICSPARATLLTGQHSHKNGIIDNRVRFDSTKVTLPKLMQAAGYQTAIIGKWHLHSQPAGFDFWKVVPGQGLYTNPRFIEINRNRSCCYYITKHLIAILFRNSAT